MLLRELAPDLWVCEQPLSMLGVRFGARMTIVRLADGSLFVHSPVRLDGETRRALDALGPVRHVVAPNRMHSLHVADFAAAYPEARLYAAPGLVEKRPAIPFHDTLSDTPPAAWADQIDQRWIQGMPVLNEVVFFHRASRTLVVTDLVANFAEIDHWPTRAWMRLVGALGRCAVPHSIRLAFRDKAAAWASIEPVLSWDIERVIVSHGVVLQHSGRRVLREAFLWLSP